MHQLALGLNTLVNALSDSLDSGIDFLPIQAGGTPVPVSNRTGLASARDAPATQAFLF
jgi:hypothetical protein